AGRRGLSSQLQSADVVHAIGPIHSSAHAPPSQLHNAPSSAMCEVAARPGRQTPPAASYPQSPSTLHPTILGAAPERFIVHCESMHVHVPGGGMLLSHPTNGVAPTHRLAMH